MDLFCWIWHAKIRITQSATFCGWISFTQTQISIMHGAPFIASRQSHPYSVFHSKNPSSLLQLLLSNMLASYCPFWVIRIGIWRVKYHVWLYLQTRQPPRKMCYRWNLEQHRSVSGWILAKVRMITWIKGHDIFCITLIYKSVLQLDANQLKEPATTHLRS